MTQYRSGEELAMRELIVPKLRAAYPSARIIHELPLRYSTNRIDLAAVTETEIISVEIKSSRDVADRLEAQLRAFLPVSTRLIVALAPKWNVELPAKIHHNVKRGYTAHIPQYTEAQSIINAVGSWQIDTWTVDATAGTVAGEISTWRSYQRPWVGKMLDILHVAELEEVARQHSLPAGRRSNHEKLVNLCHDMLRPPQIVRAVCRALRTRAAFAQGTDAPVTA